MRTPARPGRGCASAKVAWTADVNIEILRYYERRGLLSEPTRTLGGHRLYSSETIPKLRIIKAAQQLGFTLNQIRELQVIIGSDTDKQVLWLRTRGKAQKLAEVGIKLASLTLVRDALRSALNIDCADVTACGQRSTARFLWGSCPSSQTRSDSRSPGSRQPKF